MSTNKILVVWSNYYEDLAKQQLASCTALLENLGYEYAVEKVEAGTYEIPVVIRSYHLKSPFGAYIPLSLLLKGSTDHYEFIWEHVKECFIQFAMQGILLGNGIISAHSMEVMKQRIENKERVAEAVRAVDYLLGLQEKLT